MSTERASTFHRRAAPGHSAAAGDAAGAPQASSRCCASAASRRSSGPSSSAPANDNLFKFAFTVLVTYQLQVAWLPPAHGRAW